MVVGHSCPRQCGHHRFTRRFDTEHPIMPNLRSMPDAIAELVPDGASVALGVQAGAMGVPFLPTKTALGSDVTKGNHFFYQIFSPFAPKDALWAVRALNPDVTIVQVQRADSEGNAHCWGNFGVMIEGVRAAKRVVVIAEKIVDPGVIASDPNRTVVPGFLVNAVVECRYGGKPSQVQGYYKRDDAFFRQYHEQTKTKSDSDAWLDRWVYGLEDRAAYMNQLGGCRVRSEEHTSELQSQSNLVCRLLLEKKKKRE